MKYLRDVIAVISVCVGLALFGLTFILVGVILIPFSPVLAYNLKTVEDK